MTMKGMTVKGTIFSRIHKQFLILTQVRRIEVDGRIAKSVSDTFTAESTRLRLQAEQRSKKSAAHFATFDETQKILFANARKHAKGLSREGSLYMCAHSLFYTHISSSYGSGCSEQLKSNILSLRETEDSYQETVNTLIPLWTEQDVTMNSFLFFGQGLS